MIRWLLFILAFCTGCTGSLELARQQGGLDRFQAASRVGSVQAPAYSKDRCASLDDQHRTWGALAKGAAVLAGAGGLGTIPLDNKTEREVVASSSLAVAAFAAIAVALEEGAGTSWSRECASASPSASAP